MKVDEMCRNCWSMRPVEGCIYVTLCSNSQTASIHLRFIVSSSVAVWLAGYLCRKDSINCEMLLYYTAEPSFMIRIVHLFELLYLTVKLQI